MTRIVVGIDGSPGARAALDWAADQAERTGLPLVLLAVVPPTMYSVVPELGITPPIVPEEPPAYVADTLTEVAERWPALEVRTETVVDGASQALVRASEDAAYVVVGAHGRSALGRLLLGSVSQHVAAHAHCPAVVVRGTAHPGAPVAVGVDGSPAAAAALELAFAEAERRGVGLVAFHAWEDTQAVAYPTGYGVWTVPSGIGDELAAEARALVDRVLAEPAARHPDVTVSVRVERGHPTTAVIEESRVAQLLVLGVRGHGALHRMTFGSVSSAAIRHAECPVLVAPLPEE
jgi:nucleotide-binding universal stress UspA family protein